MNGYIPDTPLYAYKGAKVSCSISIWDNAGDPVALTGKALSLVVSEVDEQTALFTLTTGANTLTISGTSANVVILNGADSNTATPGEYRFTLRNTTDDTVLARGPFRIIATA